MALSAPSLPFLFNPICLEEPRSQFHSVINIKLLQAPPKGQDLVRWPQLSQVWHDPTARN